jgi:light-regulated signal transduction histidine kinase (bacteriophytochrome)
MVNAPLGHCKVADLAFGDRLQAFGGLVAIDKRTQLICACSANIQDFLGQSRLRIGSAFCTGSRIPTRRRVRPIC